MLLQRNTVFFPHYEINSAIFEEKGKERGKSSLSFYCGTVHCAKQRLQSLVGYEDLKSLPIKTSLETLSTASCKEQIWRRSERLLGWFL